MTMPTEKCDHSPTKSVVWTSENKRVRHFACECGETYTLTYKGIRGATEYVPGVDD